MLKKILSIFFVICLVFSLTVPCFSLDFQTRLFSINAAVNGYSYDNGILSISVSNGVYTLNGYSNVNGGYTRYTDLTYFHESDIFLDHVYFAWNNNPNNYYRFGYYQSTDYQNVNWNTLFQFSFLPSFLTFYFKSDYTFTNFQFSYILIDVTIFYNGSVPSDLTNDQFLSDLASYGVTFDYEPYIDKPLFQDISSVNPLPYQFSIFHVFDVANEWNSFLSPIFIFGVVIISELIFIFIGVFMFKRFRGG